MKPHRRLRPHPPARQHGPPCPPGVHRLREWKRPHLRLPCHPPCRPRHRGCPPLPQPHRQAPAEARPPRQSHGQITAPAVVWFHRHAICRVSDDPAAWCSWRRGFHFQQRARLVGGELPGRCPFGLRAALLPLSPASPAGAGPGQTFPGSLQLHPRPSTWRKSTPPVSAVLGGFAGIFAAIHARCRKSSTHFHPLSHDSVFPRNSCRR